MDMVYKAINSSEKFKKDYRLRDQITDAAVSSMSNIAKGFSRHTNTEVQSESYVALDQKYITRETFDNIYNQADKVSKLNSGRITYLLKNEKHYKKRKTTQQTQETQ